MWHAYNNDVIARNGSTREYRLTGFFFGLTIGGIPGSSHRFLGTHIITGLATGLVTGIIFHLLEKLILFKRDKT
jgi:TM2 domain-containing membrane protein YozV